MPVMQRTAATGHHGSCTTASRAKLPLFSDSLGQDPTPYSHHTLLTGGETHRYTRRGAHTLPVQRHSSKQHTPTVIINTGKWEQVCAL